MKLVCEKEMLVENVNLVMKAVSNKTTMSILECILLKCDNEGFRMIATDNEIGIRTNNIVCKVFEEGIAAVPSKMFSDIVRRLPDGDVLLETNGLIMHIKCQTSEFKISCRNFEEFPELPEVERDNRYQLNQFLLKDMIRQTIYAICQDETRTNLLGSLIEINDNVINMVTCDIFRVAHRKGEILEGTKNRAESIIVPTKTINEIFKLLSDNGCLDLFITNKHVLFDIGKCTVVSRLVEGEFLNYSNIFPEAFETKITVDRIMTVDALERAALVSSYDSRKNPVRLKINNDMVTITTAAENGDSFEEMTIDMEGNGIEICFNPKYLMEGIKCIDEEKVTLEFNSPLSPCIVKPYVEDSDDMMFRYLVLPLRLK